MQDVLDLGLDRRLQRGQKGPLASECWGDLEWIVPDGGKLVEICGNTVSEIANRRRVEKSARKEVTASVELAGVKGRKIRCTRHDLYYPELAFNLNHVCSPALSAHPVVSPVPPRKPCSRRP